MTNDIYAANGYQQNNNHNNRMIKIIAAIILTFIVLAFHCCSPAKQLAKAKQLVLTDSSSFDYVGRKFLDLHKCTEKITFKTDTLTQHDTTDNFYYSTDTLNKIDTVKQVIKITNTIRIHDTATVIDNSAIDLLREQISQRNLQIATMNGQLSGQHDIIEQQSKKITQLNWRFYGSWGGLLFIVLGFTAVKIFSKSTPTGAATSILDKIKNIKL